LLQLLVVAVSGPGPRIDGPEADGARFEPDDAHVVPLHETPGEREPHITELAAAVSGLAEAENPGLRGEPVELLEPGPIDRVVAEQQGARPSFQPGGGRLSHRGMFGQPAPGRRLVAPGCHGDLVCPRGLAAVERPHEDLVGAIHVADDDEALVAVSSGGPIGRIDALSLRCEELQHQVHATLCDRDLR
jgi:hypothetical protein